MTSDEFTFANMILRIVINGRFNNDNLCNLCHEMSSSDLTGSIVNQYFGWIKSICCCGSRLGISEDIFLEKYATAQGHGNVLLRNNIGAVHFEHANYHKRPNA